GHDPLSLSKGVDPLAGHRVGHRSSGAHGHEPDVDAARARTAVVEEAEPELAGDPHAAVPQRNPVITAELVHEVFLKPRVYVLLTAGSVVGVISGRQGPSVPREYDTLFIGLCQGILCRFLLEMGMTASSKLKDLKQAGWRFITYGLVAPNVYATMGILVAHPY